MTTTWTTIFKPAGGNPALHIMATKKKVIKKAAPKKVARKAPVKKAAAKKGIGNYLKPCPDGVGKSAPACEPALNPMNAAEEIYAFVGFLTTRDKELILSAHNDCAPIAELTWAFVKANNFPELRDGWHNVKIIQPQNTDHITNVPPIGYHEKAIASKPLTVEKAEDQMLGAILGMSTANHDATIAGFLQKILTQRNNRVQNMQKVIADVEHDMQDAMASLTTLNSVLRGEFAVVKS